MEKSQILSRSTTLPSGVGVPIDPPTQVGIVHLGWGAFHRGHQAVYTEEAMRLSGDRRWGILGDVERSPELVPLFRSQDGLYSVTEVGIDDDGNNASTTRVVGSVVDLVDPAVDTPRLLAAIASPSTHLVTLTVTEKGYVRLSDGSADMSQLIGDAKELSKEERGTIVEPDAMAPATSAIGLLARGLALRRRLSGPPITVLSCDNMPQNGLILWSVVDQLIDAALPGSDGDEFRGWLKESATFPSSMVDRITPRVTGETVVRAATTLGATDELAIASEPYTQWVIEDAFAGPRPAWELAGAEIVPDVTPWELTKLRLLNGTHSLLAYSGRLRGHDTIAAAVDDPIIRDWAQTYMQSDVLRTLTPPENADLESYCDQLMRRFSNPATGDTTTRVSSDGSQKLPIRWGDTAAQCLATDHVPEGVAFGLACWAEFVRRTVRDDGDLADPASAEALEKAVRDAGVDDSVAVTEALIALPGLLPDRIGTDPRLVSAVLRNTDEVSSFGRG